MKLDILFEDRQILVVYKPKGILSQPDGSLKEDLYTQIKKYLQEEYQKERVYLGLVHRLDHNTCGLMVYAKTSKAAKRLSEDIVNHHFEKKYLALVEGEICQKEWKELSHRLKKNFKIRKAYVDESGVEAILEYRSVGVYEKQHQKVTLVEIILKTGRFHQIRAQFEALGHSLCGDVKYGGNPLFQKDYYLEAYSLSFDHPVSKEKLHFERKTFSKAE